MNTTSKYLLFLIIALNLSQTGIAHAQNSIIDIVTKHKESFVEIKAIQTAAMKNSKPSAVLNPRTGRIIIARNIKAGYFERSGAGIIIHKSGFIVTNLHVIRGASNILVVLSNGKTLSAKVLNIVPENDLALLKVDVSFELSPITLVDSNKVSLGDKVIHVGNSKLLRDTISGGVITALGRTKSGNVEFINVNINIYEGDSGGPLLNEDGNLIGIMTAKVRSKQRHGLAVPTNKIKNLYLDFVN